MIVTNELYRQMERELLNELPIRVKDNILEYNNYVIKQHNDKFWVLYANFNGLDFIKQFYLRISALMAAKKYEAIKMQDFNHIYALDQEYCKLYNDIEIFRFQAKKTADLAKKDNYYFRLQEAKLRLEHVRSQLENLYRTTFNK